MLLNEVSAQRNGKAKSAANNKAISKINDAIDIIGQ